MNKINIPFNKPYNSRKALKNIKESLDYGKISGDGNFSHECNSLLEKELGVKKSLLTTSCTHALKMSAILLDIKPIVPSFTFVSTVNAFVLRGAIPVFVDICTDTLNMDEM